MSAVDDLDAQLLALGGDSDSDDEGEVNSTQVPDRSPTPEPVVKASVEKHDDAAPRRGVAQKIRPKRGAKAAAARRRQQSEEDGEASDPASPRSLGSDPMDHSSSDVDAPASPNADDDAPLYPLEGKFISSVDRAQILALPEIEREEILADRAQNVIRRQQDLQLKRAIAATKEKAKGHKRKAAAAEIDDDNTRKTSRPKVEKAGRTALDDYKLAREQRGAGKNRNDSRRDRRDDRSPSSGSNRDAEGESEVEWAREAESQPRRDDPPAEIKDVDRARVGRTNFAKYCFTPNFDARIKGCYVRACIGPDRERPGQNAYRMGQIKGFSEGKPYTLVAANGKPFTTDVYALVSQGNSTKPFPFLACSDTHFTHPEFERYIATLRKENIRLPTRGQIAKKLEDITALIDHQWTDEDIQAKINRQRALAFKHSPSNIFNLARTKLLDRKAAAEESGDAEEVSRCETELAALSEKERIASTASPAKIAPAKARTEQDRLAKLNEQTRRTNRDDVHKALVEEKRKRDRARAAAHAEAERQKAAAAAAAANGGLKVPGLGDLFGESDGSRAGTPRAGTPVGGVKAVRKLNGKFGQVGGRGKMEDEVIAGMDLGIDIEI